MNLMTPSYSLSTRGFRHPRTAGVRAMGALLLVPGTKCVWGALCYGWNAIAAKILMFLGPRPGWSCEKGVHMGIRYVCTYLRTNLFGLSLVRQCREIATQKRADTLKTMSPKLACRDKNWRHFALSATCRRHVVDISSQVIVVGCVFASLLGVE